MAGIKMTGTFYPGGEFGLIDDIHFIGGYRVVSDITARDSIPVLRRKWGMLCYILDTEETYILLDQGNNDLSDNSNWILYSAGNGSPSIDNSVQGYTQKFTNSDLTSGKLQVTHNLSAKNLICHVTVKDNNNSIIEPDNIVIIDKDTVEIDLSMVTPIQGTWTILITAITDENQQNEDNTKSPLYNEVVFNETTF